MEIIVVDDCSTDNTYSVIKKFEDDYPEANIKYYRLDINSGVAIARNTAFEFATGRFVAFIDSDDIWKPGKLKEQLNLFSEHKGAPFTYTAISYIDENGNQIKGKRTVKESVTYSYLLRNTMIATSTVIIDRSVVKKVVMPNRKSAEDYSLWLSLLKNYGTAYGIDKVYTEYRISNNSLSSNRLGEVHYFYDVQRKDMGINRTSAIINTLLYIINAFKKHYL